ncbi:laminin subunit alpha-like [Tachypleus tridentatus]|uniref:laminin subunit alpha-like n=1 Tax=Tachypleus tridentatus TaxID=6853 RepID=UPI003FD67780
MELPSNTGDKFYDISSQKNATILIRYDSLLVFFEEVTGYENESKGVDLEFHVAYVFIKMGISPRPGVWALERSTDGGKTYQPWQYFADTPGDCVQYFGNDSLHPLTEDDSVICETKFSKVVPLEGGEIVVSLLNDRPSAEDFIHSSVLQEWTKATNVRLRFIRTKTLLGHLMSVVRQDPTVTRRYFYSIKDINIGGRCVCNGHAETCDLTDPSDPYKLLCRCQHNTCGPQCEKCCPGFVQKKWRRALVHNPNACEPCNCFGHARECVYDENIEKLGLSLDIHGNYEGGGVCQNCEHNTEGINCNRCKPGFFRPYNKALNATDVCQLCHCDLTFSTGNCADGNGQCECRPEFLPPYCDQCNIGYYGYPQCRPCDCNVNGTEENVCEVGGGQCPCKPNYTGKNCNKCARGYYGFPDCLSCDCNGIGAISSECDVETGQCSCRTNYGGRQCSTCDVGFYNYPLCQLCSCDPIGSTEDICNQTTGECLCHSGFGLPRCDICAPGYFGFPDCIECGCDQQGSVSSICDSTGKCQCLVNFSGKKCDQCAPGYYKYPECLGELTCNVLLDECNCNPAGVLATFGGCGSLTSGELCECKERVTGRICDTCRPLFWNLQAGNPVGCEECDCYGPGTIGGINLCDGDYLVLLPQAYFEATLLQEEVNMPCKIGSTSGLCRHFRYPGLTQKSNIVKGEAAYVAVGDQRTKAKMFTEETVLTELGTGPMAWLNKDQLSLKLDLQINKPGRHALVILYHTPEGGETTNLMVDVATENQMDKGRAILYDCSYSFVCRQPVIDRMGKLAVTGKCMESHFPLSVEATKVEFESGQNENRVATELPSTLEDQQVKLIYLDHDDPMVDIHGSVPAAGSYVIVVHYYQPDHPSYDLNVLIQNGQFYEAVLPVMHCPSVSGCRSVVEEVNTNSTIFSILENFVLTLKEPDHKGIWVDYVLAIPADQFDENLLHPIKQEQAGRFVTECNKDHFFISPDVQGFCRDAVYSLTAEYNNGALPCQCDIDGSLSFECEEFGGQCKCKPNVIGRTCAQCRTGYFGFPDCQPCDCPSTAVCHPVTGQCICPPRVTGERCDSCESYTYGFDAIIGCEECNCNPLGVYRGNLQCDLLTGMCPCKSNVVGRKCDRCKPGYWGFPNCRLCNCDLRGTTENICDQRTAECFCKENVYGHFCEQCKPGTFHLEENNPLGCTKCFCFGATDRCSSAYMFKSEVANMNGWKGVGLVIDSQVGKVNLHTEIEESGSTVRAYIPEELPTGTLFYFKAPSIYLGNMITAYGGQLSYIVTTVVDQQKTFGGLVGPDVVLIGNNVTLVHGHLEQPAANLPLEVTVDILETEFRRLSGSEVSRELMMMVLVNLDGLYIRGSYFQPVQEVRLATVMLDAAVEGPIADSLQAFRVERCQCPEQYQGTSCEECAPRYYRSKTGPYLGFCQECQCNNHADSCDVNTGECMNCKHNTVGQHCEQCAPGYHGDATRGTPNDCLICACPQPTESNNFAVSCEVSESGLEISCNCKPGYAGPRCGSCSAGYFGQPQVLGSYCQPCNCSGNSNSCDSITGECQSCLNNTFGTACELCASGYYGDAVLKKNCKQCECNKCGTDRCDHRIGSCHCKPNVVGTACDECDVGFWGFKSCVGCQGCNCGPASEDNKCDVETGQCKCKPGAWGLTCDSCKPGYWQYSPEGCVSCNCVEKYSLPGAVCDPVSGECQCLPGVLNTNCQGCPYRWTFIENQGCQECGPCVHSLLDETDYLQSLIDPIRGEMTDISASYFAYRRLHNVNKTVDALRPEVNALIFDPTTVDLSPLHYSVMSVEEPSDIISLTN